MPSFDLVQCPVFFFVIFSVPPLSMPHEKLQHNCSSLCVPHRSLMLMGKIWTETPAGAEEEAAGEEA